MVANEGAGVGGRPPDLSVENNPSQHEVLGQGCLRAVGRICSSVPYLYLP